MGSGPADICFFPEAPLKNDILLNHLANNQSNQHKSGDNFFQYPKKPMVTLSSETYGAKHSN